MSCKGGWWILKLLYNILDSPSLTTVVIVCNQRDAAALGARLGAVESRVCEARRDTLASCSALQGRLEAVEHRLDKVRFQACVGLTRRVRNS